MDELSFSFFFIRIFPVSNTGTSKLILKSLLMFSCRMNFAGVGPTIPAQWTSPSSSSTFAAKASTSLSSVRSVTSISCPSPSSDSKVSESLSEFLPEMNTLAPALLRRSAVSFPIPEEAPVIRTHFPVSLQYSILSDLDYRRTKDPVGLNICTAPRQPNTKP